MPTYYKIEIHHVSVSAGDATIIAIRKNVNSESPDHLILIDAGKSQADLETIKNHSSEYFNTNIFHYVVLSHAHVDHHGALPDSDLLDNDTTNLLYGDALKSCFLNTKYRKNTKVDVSYGPYKVDLSGVSLTCYCAGGIIPNKGKIIKGKFKDENDLSMAWLLEYKGFRYFTAGDLSGATEGKYNNVEGHLLEYLYGENGPLKNKTVDVLKATHHGSKYSLFGDDGFYCENNSNSIFLKKLKPKAIIVPCNNSISPPLPTPEFFDRAKTDAYKAEEIYLVNKFEREDEMSYSKYLKLDYKYWQGRSNIVSDMVKVVSDKIVDEEVEEKTETYKSYSNTKDSDKLPVVIVYVDDDGGWAIDHSVLIDYDAEEKESKIKKTVLASLPQSLPKAYFNLRNGENCYLYYILRKQLSPSNAERIIRLYKSENDGQYHLIEGIELDIVKIYRDFIEKENFFDHLSDFPRSLRNAAKVAEKYIEDYIGDEGGKGKVSRIKKQTKTRKKEVKINISKQYATVKKNTTTRKVAKKKTTSSKVIR